MNLKHLYYFRKLADFEHFGQASKELDISQPSLSYAMSNLEQEIGVPLFKKKGRNIVLTTQGRVFRIYVERALKILESGVAYLRDIEHVNDEDALLLVTDAQVVSSAVKAAVKYLETKFDRPVIALPVSEEEAHHFVEQGLANFELTQQHEEEILKSSKETLPFTFENKKPTVRLRSDSHLRTQRLLS